MCRSLWQTPAAFTLISTWVPDGCGVGPSTSFRGALNSATWKLFIASLPVFLLLHRCLDEFSDEFLGGHCHVRPGETNALKRLPNAAAPPESCLKAPRFVPRNTRSL